ncbi:hypothetical protein JDV02_008052 [Purpureocillium takamizusanense]|uniref:PARP catalytic domain-containing protein n=1 Tax=Purpureocillium takamizusanense TaxID=2060973 RepID=A0A9Q8QLX6_9HYPO|nr:uncharacterized protein JDV02_008052 [Purpureocillium takamizusanense]UNI22133.1 hypothetical protein JDV02_008052 [Purpureocillium takamizusanense]
MAEPSDDDLIQLSVLRDEETDSLVEEGHISAERRWDSPLESTLVFAYGEMALHITPGAAYPIAQPTWEIINHSMPIDAVDALRRRLRGIVAEGALVNTLGRLHDWVDACDGSEFDYSKVVTLMVEETNRAMELFRAKRLCKTPVKKKATRKAMPRLDFDIKQGVAMSTLSSSELAQRYLGVTPQDVAAMIPPQYRVQHVEEVIRKDLAVGFDRAHAQLREGLSALPLSTLRRHAPPQLCRSARTSDYVEHLARPRLTFHGTQRRFVSSIVRHGFLRPGMRDPATGAEHGVRCGATYGRGIYSSPDAGFGLAYADRWCGRTAPGSYYGVKLIVCATLMGRARRMYREDGWRDSDEAYEGADSHVGNEGLEYVVFDPRRILPVYVVHLDWGDDDNADFFEDVPDDPAEYAAWAASHMEKGGERKTHPRLIRSEAQSVMMLPGDRQRAKEAVMARAAKYFPYGYGPATGTKFQVLEVGEVSEDEEDYGEYQEQRVDLFDTDDGKDNALDAGGYWSWQKMGELEDHGEQGVERDEYLAQKRARGPAWRDVLLPPRDEGGGGGGGGSASGEGEGDDAEDDEYEFCLGRLMGAEE